ncbi:MAG: hypothetical protein WC390_07310 [Sulfurimonas sp.]|jgi:hypothetical protein
MAALFNSITDFTGEINITQSKYGKTDLSLIIATVEEEILKSLLGEDLYLKLITDCATGVPVTQKYIDLVNGKTYSVDNEDGVTVNVNYQGIKKMLRYFTYAEILKYQESQNTEVGQVEADQNNSVRMSKSQLAVKIEKYYNNGIALYGYDIENYSDYITNPIYGNTPITDCYATYNNKYKYDYYIELVKGSCFNFLYKNKTDYPTWQFTVKDLMFLNGYL